MPSDNSEKKVENIENDKKGDATAEESKAESKKRAREDDGEEATPAKKVDSKSDVTTESS